MPDELASFLSDTLKAVYTPALAAPATGMVACCPTIIGSLDGRVPLETGGFAEKDDILGAYWWLYEYVKMTTTDYYNIRRPTPPDVFVIPSFPQPPGSGDADPGPGATDNDSFWDDALEALLALLAWGEYIAEVIAWPAAAVAGIVGGTATYPLREALYEAIELPLYNLWLSLHTYLAMTGYTMPMPGEINSGLNTLGVTVADDWSTTVAALGTFDGGLTPAAITVNPAGALETGFPRDVVLDPPNSITSFFSSIFKIGSPPVNGEYPSEFTRPWRWPGKDNEGDTVNLELPQCPPGPFAIGMNANALFGAMPGTPSARSSFEEARSEGETIKLATTLLKQGKHLGDPVDYAAYVVASLTRDGLDPATLANFNLDSDRGYAYLCWDWVRDRMRRSMPSAFNGAGDPSHGAAPTDVSQHVYPSPAQPGYGWSASDEFDHAGQPPPTGFDPGNADSRVRIRYIDRQNKVS
jgi:hypothetical protein